MVEVVDSLTIVARDSVLTALFGEHSAFYSASLADVGSSVAGASGVAAHGLVFDLVVVVVTLLYLYWSSRYIGQRLLNRYRESRLKGLGDVEGLGGFIFDTTLPWVLFIALCVIFFVKLIELLAFNNLYDGPLIDLGFGWFVVGVSLLFLLFWLWVLGAMNIWHRLIGEENMYENLFSLKVQFVRIVTIYLLPVALLVALAEPHRVAVYALFVGALIAIIYYIVKTFLLFVREKVSSLRWFLYLCTVEVAPLVLVWFIFDYLTTK